MNIATKIRPDIRKLTQYVPSPTVAQLSEQLGVPIEEIVKLDTGENHMVESLLPKSAWDQIELSRYPDPLSEKLRKALGTYTGSSPENILCGNGSDELIDLLIRCFINSGEEVIVCPPTFPMYAFYSQLAAAKVTEVLRKKNLGVDLDGVLEKISAKTKLVFIDSPGNPAGTLIKKSDVVALCKTDCIIVIDEAYFEYAGKSVVSLVKKYDNLVILRTLSKWAGLAGLRIGYAIASPAIISVVNSIKSPYNVNIFAQSIAEKVVTDPRAVLSKVRELVGLRDEIISKLQQVPGIMVFPSQSAYIVFKLRDDRTDALNDYLRQRGIILKSLNQPILGKCLRLNMGTTEEIERFFTAVSDWSQSQKQKKYDAVIFDMDGVLVDVSNSYRKVIVLTVNRFVDNRITQRDVDLIKNVVGFNNDWDASFALVTLFEKKIPKNMWKEFARNILPIDRSSSKYLEIFAIFQTFYLGSNLFESQYQKKAPFVFKNGLITSEKCLISYELLTQLSAAGYKLAIATGRPKFEAMEAIKLCKLTKFFTTKNVIALEDCKNEKPAPDPLLEAQRRIQAKNPVYIGDSPSDILASERAGMTCISVGIAGGSIQVRDVNRIDGVLL